VKVNPFFDALAVRVQKARGRSISRPLRAVLVYGVLAGLLWFALRSAPLLQIREALNHLRLWQIVPLLAINILIYLVITLRWWLIARARTRTLPFTPMLFVRVAVFGISYFTLGPQIGGEPLQVVYLQRNHGLTYTHATASVVMDKLLEFLANFILLAIGVMGFLRAGVISTSGRPSDLGWAGFTLLILLPVLYLVMLYRGHYALSAALGRLPASRIKRFISASERLAGMFCQRHLTSLIFAVLLSLLAGACMLTEFALITVFLQIHLSFWQIIAAWTAGWLSFLIPLPGGVGALEASQVFAFGALGVSAASALGVTLLVRARDLLFAGLGLLFAGGRILK
jgi:uncharacterized protein (TIRG00374 family)